jgi:cyclic pyranopterin phosphate synthase
MKQAINHNILTDRYKRQINYLRISVTDRCNLRCRYCVAPGGINLVPRSEILRYEEIFRLAGVAIDCGINKLRITGGEPLARRNITELIRMLAQIQGLADLGLTTNGSYLKLMAGEVYRAGLRRINVSLDTLNEAKYRWITRGAVFADVWSGICEALQAGFLPIKINVVVIRGFNDDELLSFARLTLQLPLEIRFIEFMPINNRRFWSLQRYIPYLEMQSKIITQEELIPENRTGNTGNAQSYKLPNSTGRISFISPLSDAFCSTCNRLRLTADGHLRNCLFSDKEQNIKIPLRQGADDQELGFLFKQSVAKKPKAHGLTYGMNQNICRTMRAIGG